MCTPRYDFDDDASWNRSAPYADDFAPTVWVPPAPCACSGYSNKHGFGAHCKGTPRAAAASALCVPRRPARPVPKLTSLASGRGS